MLGPLARISVDESLPGRNNLARTQ
ncbi:hypothetical protein BN13_860012 [Nostocoides jenkinsii Ben 74]|uniref:Uncharacterized protein n=1 Tax=Nostocoides jenkinsii Ben 74 TaxID=1193518 RepID=A0A077MGV9_9MICO|nr:hypothetical protein BN13_860012 [Tetrasphaera jenkinsii Ben 74]